MEIIKLDSLDLLWAWGIILLIIVVSRWQKLGLEGQFFIASIRAILQLMFIGYVLEFIFAVNNAIAVIGIILIMITIASVVARNRIDKKMEGLLQIIWGALFVSVSLAISYTIILIIQPENWYNPQYLIPMVGMILGNILNSASLSGERLASMIKNNHLEIETHLSLGATAKQAIRQYQLEAVKIGVIPILNSMMIVGLVSIPGMFTGQVLGGNSPLDAASYQILILFMIAFANVVTVCLITEGVYRNFFNAQQQLIIK